jgi:hypothetical protein
MSLKKRTDKKTTPCKGRTSKNGQICTDLDMSYFFEKEANLHGQLSWCAAKELCNNTIDQANEEHGCSRCKIAAHEECMVHKDCEGKDGTVTQTILCVQCHINDTKSDGSETTVEVMTNSKGGRNHYIDMDATDPLQEEQKEQEKRSTKYDSVDSSFTIISDEKNELIKKILQTEHISSDIYTNEYTHALANISSFPIPTNNINPSTRQCMFTESKKKVDFDRRALYGKWFKILARWINIAVPKGKVTQKPRDELIVINFEKGKFEVALRDKHEKKIRKKDITQY